MGIHIIAIMAAMAAIILILIRFYFNLSRFFREIRNKYKDIAIGNYNIRFSKKYKGALGRVEDSFVLMAKEIESTVNKLNKTNGNIKAVLQSLHDGVIAFDNDGNLIMINEPAKKYINNYEDSNLEDKPLAQIIKNEDMYLIIEQILYDIKSNVYAYEIENEFYNIEYCPIYDIENSGIRRGTLLLIENVTEKVNLESIRSQFVTNVTHELKTPLTSINGFVETLKNNPNIEKEKQERFLDIIESESNRLKVLIDDILTLSFIERNTSPKIKQVDLVDIIEQSMDISENIAHQKNIDLIFKHDEEELQFYTNGEYITQLLLNLIDNAIKYSKEDTRIEVKLKNLKDSISIEVKDQGCGIPEIEQEHVFERFYRVDKARSKREQGTGLGLAIVKHLVLTLDGKISIDSKVDQGSTFKVVLPKKFSE